jgi:hypothetical protein
MSFAGVEVFVFPFFLGSKEVSKLLLRQMGLGRGLPSYTNVGVLFVGAVFSHVPLDKYATLQSVPKVYKTMQVSNGRSFGSVFKCEEGRMNHTATARDAQPPLHYATK